MKRNATRLMRLLVGCLVLLAPLAGCGGGTAAHSGSATPAHVPHQTGLSRSPSPMAKLLRNLGARQIYVMSGSDVLHASLGVLDSEGIRAAQVSPPIPLVSNIAGNGTAVVVGGAGVTPNSYTDGVYQIVGKRLITLARPARAMYGPTIALNGTVAAIHPEGGFSWRSARSGRWRTDARLQSTPLGSLTWNRANNAYALIRGGTQQAALVRIPKHGAVRQLNINVSCAISVLSAPTKSLVATTVSGSRHEPAACRRARAQVLKPSHRGSPILIPRGWNPIAWSADSSTLLLTRGTTVSTWKPGSSGLAGPYDLKTKTWMAAPIYE